MRLYHGSNTGGIKELVPFQADHDRPYIYLSENQVVASFYIINCVERPYYWFPYGFSKGGVPYYDELYPDALRKACEGKRGVIYEVDADPSSLIPFKNIPGAWLSTAALQVKDGLVIDDPHAWFMQCEREGKLLVRRYEQKTAADLALDDKITVRYLLEKHMITTPDCSYALFIKKMFPWVWERYCLEEEQRGEEGSAA